MTRNGYEAYKLYLALQRHFSTDYDFFLYGGKIRASTDSYQKRKDIFAFEKLSKVVPKEDLVDFFVCHFIENPKEWIRNMNPQNLQTYKSKWKRMKSTFKEDLQTLKSIGPAKALRVDNDIPLIHKSVISGDFSIESVILIDAFIFPFLDKHYEEVDVPFVWPEHQKLLKKYRPFTINKVDGDKDVYVDIAKTVLK